MPGTAAIVTIGSELVEGLRVDTNTAEVARDLQRYGFRIAEATSVGDDESALAAVLARLCASHDLVVCTGGLGPTHDDVTRDAAAAALGRTLSPDPDLETFLRPFVARHTHAGAAEHILSQALVIDGAEVLEPRNGTAAGQVVPTPAGSLLLLPGPPREMRPMLARFLERFEPVRAAAIEIGVVGRPESDVQLAAQRALETFDGIALTVLAAPGDAKAVLLDEGAGPQVLREAAVAVASEIGEAAYSTDGSTLAQVLVRESAARGVTLATAESCTGGMVAAAITDVPGSSDAFLGGVVAYANSAKMDLLDVPAGLLAQYGAVSEECARAMAEGARSRFGADLAIATTGIAGPGGGTAEKPVGLVWFAVASDSGTSATSRTMTGATRYAVRARSTALALDLLRREVLGASGRGR